MNRLFRVAHLIRLILTEGKFRHSGHDFQNARSKALEGLTQFCPAPDGTIKNRPVLKNPFVRSWFGQAVFIKNALKRKGRHLSAPALNLCYIRNPKAASTALTYAMLSACHPELKDFALTPEKINFLADVTLNQQLSSAQREWVFFSVVRNPFARIVSVYREFFERRHDHFLYEDYLFGILREDHSFRQFLHILQVIPDRLKDQHLTPQYTLLTFYERQGVQVKILKLEEPEAVHQFLYPYGLTLKAINKREAYDYRTYFDKETLELVYRLYHKDIHHFGYEAVLLELKQRVGAKNA
ncbi:MAG: sulfotransferase family 2 domain-containing protein [Cyclobacteriaceae bacterium]